MFFQHGAALLNIISCLVFQCVSLVSVLEEGLKCANMHKKGEGMEKRKDACMHRKLLTGCEKSKMCSPLIYAYFCETMSHFLTIQTKKTLSDSSDRIKQDGSCRVRIGGLTALNHLLCPENNVENMDSRKETCRRHIMMPLLRQCVVV